MNYKIEKKLNIVLFGSGKAGNYHASSILKIKNVNIFGVVNSGKKDPEEFRNKYKIDKWIKSYRDLKSIIENIDAFILTSPSEKTLEILKNISSYNINNLKL